MAELRERADAWAWDEATLRAAAHRVADLAVDHLIGLRDRPVFAALPPELADRWRAERWAEDGVPFEELLRELEQHVLAFPMGNGHPRFHAWVNSPPDRAAVLAGLLASAADPSCAGGNHAALHIERQVIRWLAEFVGMTARAGGLLVSGGSMATVVALAAARQACAPFDPRVDGLAGGTALTVYASGETHSCVTKAVELLGIGRGNLHLLSTDREHRLDPDGLERELAARRAATSIRSPRSPTRERPAPERLTPSRRSPRSAPATACGCTSTARTARRRSSPSATGPGSQGWRSPTASRSIRTNGCTSRSMPASCWFVNRSGCATRSAWSPRTCASPTIRAG